MALSVLTCRASERVSKAQRPVPDPHLHFFLSLVPLQTKNAGDFCASPFRLLSPPRLRTPSWKSRGRRRKGGGKQFSFSYHRDGKKREGKRELRYVMPASAYRAVASLCILFKIVRRSARSNFLFPLFLRLALRLFFPRSAVTFPFAFFPTRSSRLN